MYATGALRAGGEQPAPQVTSAWHSTCRGGQGQSIYHARGEAMPSVAAEPTSRSPTIYAPTFAIFDAVLMDGYVSLAGWWLAD